MSQRTRAVSTLSSESSGKHLQGGGQMVHLVRHQRSSGETTGAMPSSMSDGRKYIRFPFPWAATKEDWEGIRWMTSA